MINRNILMIGDPFPYLNYLCNMEGVSITLFQAPERMNVTNIKQLSELYVFDIEDTEKALALSKTLHNLKPFDAVWSFVEMGLLTAAVVADSLGLRCTTERAVRLTRDKREMRQILNEHNISRVEYLVTNQLTEAENFVSRIGLPVILKPVHGTGSSNVYKVESHKELVDIFTHLKHSLAGRDKFIIEEFLEGPEVSVEFMTIDGQHIPLTITDKMTTEVRCVEVGHTMPSILPNETQQDVFDLVSRMLSLINHRVGPTHTEVKITPKGPRIIEAHTRPGGDFIVYMIEHAFHVNLIPLTIQHLVGEPVEVTKGREGAAAVRYFEINPGRIEAIEGIEMLKKHPNLLWLDFNMSVGDIVSEMVSTFTRHGCFVIHADSLQQVHQLAEDLLNSVQIITTPIINEQHRIIT